MAIAFDAVARSNNGSGGTSTLSYNITVGSGSDRFIYVAVGWNNPNSPTITSVKYNSVDMTLVGSLASGAFKLALYYTVAPTSGTNAVDIVMSGNTEILSGAASYTGVDGSTPFSGYTTFNDDGGDFPVPSLTVTSTATGLVVGALVSGGGSARTCGDTERWNQLAYDYRHHGSDAPGTGGSVVLDWSTGSGAWAMAGMNLIAASGSGGPVIPVFTRQYRARAA